MQTQPASSNPPDPSNPAASTNAYSMVLIGVLLLCLLFGALVYTFAHEAGHVLAGLLFGGELTSFSVNFFNLSAHAGIQGDFSPAQSGVVNAAGVLFAYLAWAVFMLAAPRRGGPVLDILKLLISMMTIHALLAWVVIPLVGMGGQPVADDSYHFVQNTGFPPPAVSAAALLLYFAGWALTLRQMDGWRGIYARLQALQVENYPALRRSLAWMAAITLGILTVVGAISTTVAELNPYSPPQGYTLAARFDLAQVGFENEPAYTFTLEAPGQVSLYFLMKDIQAGPVRIDLAGPDGYSQTFMRFDDKTFRAGQASVHPDPLDLPPGEYRVLLTFPQTGGSLEIYTLDAGK